MKPIFDIHFEKVYLADEIHPQDKRQALRWSIAKWKFICANITTIKFDGTNATCGLCLHFQKYPAYRCTDCPIRVKTQHSYCKKTPYQSWCRAADFRERTEAAEKMLAFLRKLYKELYGSK